MRDSLTELSKLIRIALTVPVTTVICETSFSKLRRLKTFTWASTSAKKLNDEMIVHVNRDFKFSIAKAGNAFINKVCSV